MWVAPAVNFHLCAGVAYLSNAALQVTFRALCLERWSN